ncbi:MAG: 50S ribosomal protein L44e [Promethearchaeota archaeon]
MKFPKNKRKYCKNCNTHTPHKVSIYKKGKETQSAQGNRRYARKKKGYGSQPKPIQHNQAKVNKKTTPTYKCSKCGRVTIGTALRLKKFELINK